MPVQRLDCVGGAARRVRTARGQQWTGLRPVAPHDLVQRTRRPAARTGCRRINAAWASRARLPGAGQPGGGRRATCRGSPYGSRSSCRRMRRRSSPSGCRPCRPCAAVPSDLPLLRLRHDPTQHPRSPGEHHGTWWPQRQQRSGIAPARRRCPRRSEAYEVGDVSKRSSRPESWPRRPSAAVAFAGRRRRGVDTGRYDGTADRWTAPRRPAPPLAPQPVQGISEARSRASCVPCPAGTARRCRPSPAVPRAGPQSRPAQRTPRSRSRQPSASRRRRGRCRSR